MSRLFSLVLLSALSPGLALAQRGFSAEVEQALESLKDEPSIQATQKAALTFFNIDADTVSSMRTRAKIKALVPLVTAKLRKRDEAADLTRIDHAFSDTEPLTEDDVAGDWLEWEVAGAWNLDRLVFNPEVLDVSSLAVLQEGVLKEVTRLFYTRRRLQVDLILSPPNDPATRLSKQLRIDELTSTLDAMTGNLFSRNLKKRSRGQKRRRRR